MMRKVFALLLLLSLAMPSTRAFADGIVEVDEDGAFVDAGDAAIRVDSGVENATIERGAPEKTGTVSASPRPKDSVAPPPIGSNGEPEAIERITWDKRPIPITLVSGKERLIQFPGSVRVGVPGEIRDILRTQSVEGTVYWFASEPFDTSRVQVQDVHSGRIVMIDLAAVEADADARSIPIEIVLPEDSDATTIAAEEPENETEEALPEDPDYVELTRFAAQQLYAPARLLPTAPNIHGAGVRQEAVALVRGLKVEAIPVAAWRGGFLYVTAVKLRNRSRDEVILDPRTSLRGAWRAITFQHAVLHPAGTETDTSAVFLVSDHPFEECL